MADAMEMMLLSFLAPTLVCEWNLTSTQEAAITTVVFIGMFFGASTWGLISDRFGRRKGYLLVNIFTFCMGLLSAFSPNYGALLFFRGVTGFGVGGVHIAFTLFAEFLPNKARGGPLLLLQLFWSAGSMLSALLAMATIPTLGWRYFLVFSAIPFSLLIFIYPIVPESPRYLLAKGHVDAATKILETAAALNHKTLPEGTLSSRLDVPTDGSPARLSKTGQISELLAKSIRSHTLLLWVIWFASAFSYYGMVLMVTQLFADERDGSRCPEYGLQEKTQENTGCTPLQQSDYLAVFTTSSAEVPSVLLTALCINLKFMGRKNTIALGFATVCLMALLIVPCTSRGWETFFMFDIRMAITGAFQAVYIYTTEFYPTTIRTTGMGISSSVARIGGIATPFVANVVGHASVYAALFIYAFVSFLAVICALCLSVETLGWPMTQTLKELEQKMGTAKRGNICDCFFRFLKTEKSVSINMEDTPRTQSTVESEIYSSFNPDTPQKSVPQTNTTVNSDFTSEQDS